MVTNEMEHGRVSQLGESFSTIYHILFFRSNVLDTGLIKERFKNTDNLLFTVFWRTTAGHTTS